MYQIEKNKQQKNIVRNLDGAKLRAPFFLQEVPLQHSKQAVFKRLSPRRKQEKTKKNTGTLVQQKTSRMPNVIANSYITNSKIMPIFAQKHSLTANDYCDLNCHNAYK